MGKLQGTFNEDHTETFKQIREKCQSFHVTSGLTISATNDQEELLFQYKQPETEPFQGDQRFLCFRTCLGETFFTMRLGPMHDDFTHQESGKVFQWLMESYDGEWTNDTIHQSYVEDLSLLEVYETEPIHASIDHADLLKRIIQTGNRQELEYYFRNNPLLSFFKQIKLAKGDELRSMKNHVIVACGILSQYAIDCGVENEYARTLADRYISFVETVSSQGDLGSLIKEFSIKIGESIHQFSNPAYSHLTKQVIHYLQTHFYEKLSLEQVATICHVSPSHLSKVISRETGMSFTDNLNTIRINESKKQLLQTKQSVLEIALAVGFSYQNHFGKVFKQIVGVSPKTFRNQRIESVSTKEN